MKLPFLPILILALPLAEIAVFVLVGSHIGALATVALVIATSIVGGVLLRIQGLGALERIRTVTEAGDVPGRDLVHGAMIMIAGVLLLLPGFITDTLGLLMFIPPLREAAWRFVKSRIVVVDLHSAAAYSSAGRHPGRGGRTIDLDEEDYERQETDDTDDVPPHRPHIEDRR